MKWIAVECLKCKSRVKDQLVYEAALCSHLLALCSGMAKIAPENQHLSNDMQHAPGTTCDKMGKGLRYGDGCDCSIFDFQQDWA
jgi:hypothetical protein